MGQAVEVMVNQPISVLFLEYIRKDIMFGSIFDPAIVKHVA